MAKTTSFLALKILIPCSLARPNPISTSKMKSWSWNPFTKAPNPSPLAFGSSSTAEEVTRGLDATNLTAIVTGGASGIGRETTRVLAMRGATVVVPCRSLESGRKVKDEILEGNPSAKVEVLEMDLSSLDSVERFASAFSSSYRSLNILINNAWIMACPFQLSKDGVELQFATNHLGHFLLTNLLLEKMVATAKESGIQGRIVTLSSALHARKSDEPCFDLEKLNDSSKYSAFGAYAYSKLANIWHVNELSRRLQENGHNVTANSLHPGVIATNLGRHMITNKLVGQALSLLMKPFLKSIPQGAATTCYLALHPALKDVTGKYFGDCHEETPSVMARDADLSMKCWDFSQELIEKLHTGK